MAEIFDICNEHDQVIGQATRAEVHAQDLLHRAVHIWVFNSKNELMFHMRTATKDQYPNCYTSSASGHVDAGEIYEAAAHRELSEELQLSGNLERIVHIPASKETAFEHTVLYRLITDETPTPDPMEIKSIEYHSFAKIEQMVQQTPELFTPPFRELVDWGSKNR